MSTHAVGVDVIETQRVGKVLSKHPERFLQRVYTPAEVGFCRGRVPELAARFAAKEAVMKTLGTGARSVAWRDIEVLPDRRGKPLVYLYGGAQRRAEFIGLEAIDISLTHLEGIAMAVVVATATKPEFEHAESRARLVQFLQARGLMGEDEQNS